LNILSAPELFLKDEFLIQRKLAEWKLDFKEIKEPIFEIKEESEIKNKGSEYEASEWITKKEKLIDELL
jgi:hypothetical protein